MTPKCPDCKRDQDDCICASPASAPKGWKPLTDVQWMNIVNLNHAWENVDKEDAINEVFKLVEAECKANNLAASPTQPASEDQKDAEIERLNSLVESVRSNNEALHHARDLLRSEVNKQSAALKLAREALQGIHPGNMTPMAEKNWMEALAAIEALKGE